MASLREHIGAQPCNRGRNQPHDEVVGRAFQAERSARAKTLKSEPVWQIEGQAGLVWMERRPPGDTGRGRQSGRPGPELTVWEGSLGSYTKCRTVTGEFARERCTF